MSGDNVIKFGKSKKALQRKAKEKRAQENRVSYGGTKSEKMRDKKISEKLDRKLDGHKTEE